MTKRSWVLFLQPLIFFSRELAKVNFYGVSALSKMVEEEITVGMQLERAEISIVWGPETLKLKTKSYGHPRVVFK